MIYCDFCATKFKYYIAPGARVGGIVSPRFESGSRSYPWGEYWDYNF